MIHKEPFESNHLNRLTLSCFGMPGAFTTCKGTGFLGGSNPPLHGHSLTASFTHEGVPMNMPLLDIAQLYRKG